MVHACPFHRNRRVHKKMEFPLTCWSGWSYLPALPAQRAKMSDPRSGAVHTHVEFAHCFKELLSSTQQLPIHPFRLKPALNRVGPNTPHIICIISCGHHCIQFWFHTVQKKAEILVTSRIAKRRHDLLMFLCVQLSYANFSPNMYMVELRLSLSRLKQVRCLTCEN